MCFVKTILLSLFKKQIFFCFDSAKIQKPAEWEIYERNHNYKIPLLPPFSTNSRCFKQGGDIKNENTDVLRAFVLV
jgi:hypothetical protein